MPENEVILPDNSHSARQERKEREKTEEKRAQKVVRGKVKTKKNEMRKLSDIFISEDAANVKNHLLMDVIVPTIKKTLYEAITTSLDMILFGGRGRGDRRSTASRVSYTNYNGVSRDRDRDRGERSRVSTRYSYDDIVFETRADAKDVLDRMDEILDQYDYVTVADMFDLAGLTGEHTDHKYGWKDIRNAEIVSTRDGYIIKMPRAIPFNR